MNGVFVLVGVMAVGCDDSSHSELHGWGEVDLGVRLFYLCTVEDPSVQGEGGCFICVRRKTL